MKLIKLYALQRQRGAGIDLKSKVGVSTNHVIAVDGKVEQMLNIQQIRILKKKQWRKESFNIKTGINASGTYRH